MGYRSYEPVKCLQCERPAAARKLCKKHYYAAKRTGTISQFSCLAPEDVFMSRIEKTDSCWLWKGTKNEYGYGIMLMPGEKPVRAHRYVYEQLVGPIPEGLILLHSCDNPPCVNPAHLTPGTKAENLQDSMKKGRRAVGEKHWNSKLSAEQIKAIIADPRSQAEIAKEYGLSQPYIGRIKRGTRRTYEPT